MPITSTTTAGESSKQALLLTELERDLTRPQALPTVVASALAARAEEAAETLEYFVANTLDTLDDVTLDLIFSPLFTPTLAAQSRYASLLQDDVLAKEQLQQLVEQLTAQKARIPCTLETGETLLLPLLETMVARYIGRLHLDKPIPAALYQTIQRTTPADLQGTALALGRDSLWQDAARCQLLCEGLERFASRQSYQEEKLKALVGFIRTYRLRSSEQLYLQMKSLISSCEADMATADQRSYFDETLRQQYGGQAADVKEAHQTRAHYQHYISLATELLQDFSSEKPSPVIG
ncbi:MAG: hypothetical protein SFZ03_09110 [Candidatus Melainabacteria bacterium]|nr:hypothetical protein [Candidatus Melainabacteria bacterium]